MRSNEMAGLFLNLPAEVAEQIVSINPKGLLTNYSPLQISLQDKTATIAEEAVVIAAAHIIHYPQRTLRSMVDRGIKFLLIVAGQEPFGTLGIAQRKLGSGYLGYLVMPEEVHPSTLGQCHPYGLSDRQMQVLQAMARPVSYASIADMYHLSVNTIKTHVRSIYEKLGVQSRQAAVEKGLQEGFLL